MTSLPAVEALGDRQEALRARSTIALSSTEGSWSRWRKSWIAVTTSSSPKIRNMNEKAASSAAPSAMKIARRTSASEDAEREHALLVLGGTANALMSSTKTNRLSTDRLFSTM